MNKKSETGKKRTRATVGTPFDAPTVKKPTARGQTTDGTRTAKTVKPPRDSKRTPARQVEAPKPASVRGGKMPTKRAPMAEQVAPVVNLKQRVNRRKNL